MRTPSAPASTNPPLPTNLVLSTQQIADFLVQTDFDRFNDFPDIDATVEKVLVEAEVAGPVSLCSPMQCPCEHRDESAITNHANICRLRCKPRSLCSGYICRPCMARQSRIKLWPEQSRVEFPRKPRCRLTGQSMGAVGQEPEQQAFARRKAIQR